MLARAIGVAVVALALAAPAYGQGQAGATVRVLRAAAVLDAPQGTANAVGTVNPGEIFEVLDERDGWYLVRPPAGSTHAWRTAWVNGASVERMGAGNRGGGDAPAQPGAAPAGRKGFIIGLGGGVGMHTAPIFPGFNQSQTTSDLAIVTDFRIGYAPTDQVLVYYRNTVGWTRSGFYDLLGLSGVGGTYFFKPSSPSSFVGGVFGATVGSEVDFGSGTFGDTERGTGIGVNGGWELARHWSVEGHAIFFRLGRNNDHRLLAATFNWMFY